MGKLDDNPGDDIPIDCAERQFTLSDAAFLAGVPEKSLYNWIERSVIVLSDKVWLPGAKTSRWMFSVYDTMKVSIVFDLAVRTRACELADAASAAEVAVAAAIKADAAAHRDGIKPNVNVALYWDRDGKLFCMIHDVKNAAAAYPPPPGKRSRYQPTRRVFSIIPATALLHDTINAALDLRDKLSKGASGDD